MIVTCAAGDAAPLTAKLFPLPRGGEAFQSRQLVLQRLLLIHFSVRQPLEKKTFPTRSCCRLPSTLHVESTTSCRARSQVLTPLPLLPVSLPLHILAQFALGQLGFFCFFSLFFFPKVMSSTTQSLFSNKPDSHLQPIGRIRDRLGALLCACAQGVL